MLIILISLIFIILFRIRITKSPGEMDLDETKAMKGICAVTIVLAHIIQNMNNVGVISFIGKIGYLCVAFFFFFSGYGLAYSYKNKKGYLDSFFYKRLSSIIIPLIGCNILYQVYKIFSGEKYSLNKFLYYIIRTDKVVSFSWYVFVIALFYILFYFCYKKSNPKKALLTLGLCILLYIIILNIFNIPDVWYKSCIPFLFGVIYGQYKEKIVKFIKNNFYKCITLTVVIALIMLVISLLLLGNTFKAIILSSLIVIAYILFSYKFSISNFITIFLGEISYEIYLIQGLFLAIFKDHVENLSNLTFAVGILSLTIILAYILHSIFVRINMKIIRNRCKGCSKPIR